MSSGSPSDDAQHSSTPDYVAPVNSPSLAENRYQRLVAPATQSAIPPTALPVTQLAVQPCAQNVISIAQPVARPATQPVAQPITQSVTQPAQPATQSATHPPGWPIAQGFVPPVAHPVAHPVVDPGLSQPTGHTIPQYVPHNVAQAIHSGDQQLGIQSESGSSSSLVQQPTTQHTQHVSRQLPHPFVAQNMQPNSTPLSAQSARPTQPSRTARYARPAPYSKPKGPQTQTEDKEPLPHKRPCGPQSSNRGGNNQATTRANVLTQAAPPGSTVIFPETTSRPVDAPNETSTDDLMANATRQLAQPRETPGSSQCDRHTNTTTDTRRPTENTADASRPSGLNQDMDRDTGEEVMEGLQAENDEINLCRLVARVLQKQDAICRTLQGMKHTRRTAGSESAPPGDGSGPPPSPGAGSGSAPPPGNGPTPASNDQRPPRTSPPQAGEPVNWDQTVRSTQPAGRQPRVARRILISNTIRREMNKLLKRKNNKQSLPLPPPPEIRYPTEENFGI
ncbi:hypothetical protein FRC07_004087 [Ceratobasidium sp. 392]|nr:hypothetical protein FRC07_004087 [Ceratobasidium sp. 392]